MEIDTNELYKICQLLNSEDVDIRYLGYTLIKSLPYFDLICNYKFNLKHLIIKNDYPEFNIRAGEIEFIDFFIHYSLGNIFNHAEFRIITIAILLIIENSQLFKNI